MKTAKQIVRQVAERIDPTLGCSDHGCVFGHPGGMGTNGGCDCLKERNPYALRKMVMQLSQVAHTLAAVGPGAGEP